MPSPSAFTTATILGLASIHFGNGADGIRSGLRNGVKSVFDSADSSLIEKFHDFQDRFQKFYSNMDDLEYRFKIFVENWHAISKHNSDSSRNFTLGINQFSDLTDAEFRELFTGGFAGSDHTYVQATSCKPYSYTGATVPSSVDWRTKNAVTPVKDQGQCGSCWSFSATGAMEGAHAIATGSLVSLSEQQLVDCSHRYGNLGCNGGLMDNAFKYAIDSGMCAENAYPYTASGGTCHSCTTVTTISACKDVAPNNQVALREAVAKGPVSIAIEADSRVFQSYSSGVITSADCGTNLDHGVLIVGYGVENNIKYWLVKNSWGTSWGDKGYVKIGRSESTNDPGICGIAMEPSFPSV